MQEQDEELQGDVKACDPVMLRTAMPRPHRVILRYSEESLTTIPTTLMRRHAVKEKRPK